ncbi:hypothetical protein C0991_001402 [Blastosporella zonata]|nr:hypothetical protein C0991_001402 [Blastosporella zonata]
MWSAKQLKQSRSAKVVLSYTGFSKHQNVELKTVVEDDAALTQSLLERSIERHELASEHRLRQPSKQPMNSALQAAHRAKEAIAAIKMQVKGNTFTVQMALSIFPQNGTAPKKVQILPLLRKYNGSEPTADMFEYAKVELKAVFLRSPPSQQFRSSELNFNQPTFGVGANKVHQLEYNTGSQTETIESFFNTLKSGGHLSDADIKSKTIPLRVFVYHIIPDSDEEDDIVLGPYKTSMRQSAAPLTAQKQGLSAKQKASKSLSSSVPQYTSTFRPRKILAAGGLVDVEIPYDRYKFTTTTFMTDAEGNVDEHIGIEEQTIKIASDWQSHIDGGVPMGGYLAKGLMKFAFLGRFDNRQYAIFQCKPITVTASQNLIDLTAELRLMALGQYFADSFKRRAYTLGIDVLSLRWNFSGAFLGSVISELPPPPEGDKKDTRSLIFKEFLAAPLLSTRGLYTERKFSGCNEAGDNSDHVGCIVDAYAHHVLIDSGGTLLMTDLQGTFQNTGFWDEGIIAMKKWQSEHKCKALCRKLGLDTCVVEIKEVIASSEENHCGPLRHGFPSPSPKVESP